MIAVNGKKFTELKEGDPVLAHINGALKAIRKQRFYRLRFSESLVKKAEPGSTANYEETPSGDNMLASQKYAIDGVEHDIAYFQNTRKEGKVLWPRHLMFNGIRTFDSHKEADLIFYFVCLSPFCAIYPELEKFQNPSRRNIVYEIYDESAIARRQVEEELLILKVKRMIFDSTSGISDRRIRELGLQFNVRKSNNPDVDISVIRNGLSNRILAVKDGNYNKNLIEEFMDSAMEDEVVLVEGLNDAIDQAFDGDLVKVRKHGQNTHVKYLDLDDLSKEGKTIFKFKGAGNEDVLLEQFLLENQKQAKAFVEYVAEVAKVVTEAVDG